MLILRQRFVLFQLVDLQLLTRSRHGFAVVAIEPKSFEKSFSLSRVGFIFDSPINPSQYTVEYGQFLGIVWAWSQSSSFLQLVLLLQDLLEAVDLAFGPCCGEVISVDAHR